MPRGVPEQVLDRDSGVPQPVDEGERQEADGEVGHQGDEEPPCAGGMGREPHGHPDQDRPQDREGHGESHADTLSLRSGFGRMAVGILVERPV